MYTEDNKSSINWGNLIKKGIIVLVVALLVFFIIWLFIRGNNDGNVNVNYEGNEGNSNVNENGPSNLNDTLPSDVTYSREFLEGYRYFHDTAKEYFLISELPSNGRTLKYTLREFIDKELIFAWEYKDGKSCDAEGSYAYVTNNDGTYELTVSLTCGTEVAKTVEELGCNQLCLSGNCENTPQVDNLVKEYQFRQPYTTNETVYECEPGYTRSGTKCIKDNKYTVKATKVVSYDCLPGYTKSGTGENTICTRGKTDIVNATKTVSYNCEPGYTKSGTGENTTCYKTGSSYRPAKYKVTESCQPGFTRSGNSCVKTESVNPYTTLVWGCPAGYSQSGSICTKTETKKATITEVYNCQAGFTKNGKSCTKTETIKATAVKGDYSCKKGYTLSGSKCLKSETKAATPHTTYSCPKGTPINNGRACRITSKTSYNESYYVYHGSTYQGCKYQGSYPENCSNCANGRRTAYKYSCSKNSYKDVAATANTYYSCPAGYTQNGAGKSTSCTKTTSIDAIAGATSYKCKSGYSLNGSSCSRTVTTSASVSTTYSCEAGYTRNGSSCSRTISTNATSYVSYSCPSGYKQNGSGNNTTCTKATYSNLIESKSYYCDSNEILSGDRCYYDYTDAKKPTMVTEFSCEKGYTRNGMKCSMTTEEKRSSIKDTKYACEPGYTKIGMGSESKCTKGATTSVDAKKSTKKVTKYRYKWSTEESLSGWERTGEVRESKVTNPTPQIEK